MALLAIENNATYDDILTGMEYHSHFPYASTTFKNNDEIRIPIAQQDIITAPYESTLVVSGKVSGKKANGTAVNIKLANNAIAFLFEDIRYEINGVEIDRTKNVGITSTLKNILSERTEEKNNLKNACWFGAGETLETSDFTFSVPLKMLLGFAEDYKKIVLNVKQELVLLRTASDSNAIVTAEVTDLKFDITRLYWRVPHINVNDAYRLKMYKMIEKDATVHVPFRSWELHEQPSLPETKEITWTVKTSTQLEKPRYVILAFQIDKKNHVGKDMSTFDACNLTDVRVYLNSQYYPYDKVRGNFCMFYEMFRNFQYSYYGKPGSTVMDPDNFKSKTPIYVIDCSKQNDSIKTGPVEIRLEIEASSNFPANTTAYCLLLHDAHMTYTLLTGSVKKITT